MTGLTLDTHIALWLDSGDERLGTTSRNIIDQPELPYPPVCERLRKAVGFAVA